MLFLATSIAGLLVAFFALQHQSTLAIDRLNGELTTLKKQNIELNSQNERLTNDLNAERMSAEISRQIHLDAGKFPMLKMSIKDPKHSIALSRYLVPNINQHIVVYRICRIANNRTVDWRSPCSCYVLLVDGVDFQIRDSVSGLIQNAYAFKMADELTFALQQDSVECHYQIVDSKIEKLDVRALH